MAKDKGTIKAEPKKKGRKPQWTDAKVEIMCAAIAKGQSYKDAYTAARVGHDSFYRHLRDDSDFSEKVKKAEQEYQDWYDSQLVVECKRSLIDLVRGFEYDETTTETIPGKDGKGVITKTKVVHKRVMPNPTAIIFALSNRDPEHYQNRVTNELTGTVKTETQNTVSLKKVPDDLLAQVIEALRNEK